MLIKRQALVLHSALDMYRLVHDVAAYPGFLSWCTHAEILEQTSDMQLATLEVAIGSIRQRFTTRNRLQAGERLVMQLVEGPFRALAGEWRFQALGEAGSKVSLEMDFKVSGSLMSSAFRTGFAHVADRMVRDFSRRADAVYGAE